MLGMRGFRAVEIKHRSLTTAYRYVLCVLHSGLYMNWKIELSICCGLSSGPAINESIHRRPQSNRGNQGSVKTSLNGTNSSFPKLATIKKQQPPNPGSMYLHLTCYPSVTMDHTSKEAESPVANEAMDTHLHWFARARSINHNSCR